MSTPELSSLWDEHMLAPYPSGFRGVDIAGVELILLDADVAGLVQRELHGGLDDEGVAILWGCIAALDKALPLIGDDYCATYYAHLRTMAEHVAARYLPAAT